MGCDKLIGHGNAGSGTNGCAQRGGGSLDISYSHMKLLA